MCVCVCGGGGGGGGRDEEEEKVPAEEMQGHYNLNACYLHSKV